MSKREQFEKIFKEHLKVETFSKSIDSLYSLRSRNKIDYSPYYQRNYVWDHHKASYFIESVLMGTEIPPLIFFDNNNSIEVIDGRQRYETILRFMNNEFSLTKKGLSILTQLKGASWDSLGKNQNEIIESFLDSKLRIIEFKLVNKPPLDPLLQDKVKKEIFSRYNSGITPLKKAEIDNAIYDDDQFTNYFKKKFDEDNLMSLVFSTFFKQPVNAITELPTEKILTFTRRSLIMPMYPINYYVRGTGRTNTLSKLYEYFTDENSDNEKSIYEDFSIKVNFLNKVKNYSTENDLKINRLSLECFLWGLGVLDLEEFTYNLDDDFISTISDFIDENIGYYTLVDYNFTSEVMARYLTTADFFKEKFDVNLDIYITADSKTKEHLKELNKPGESTTRLEELESLRLSKPEPANNSIDDIVRTMSRKRFLIRPSYQRKEVINPNKASSIIESILLGIKLPPIFIYKREDGVNEVIDGQQRLLTILGYIGEDFLNEKNKLVKSKNHKFKLRKLRILKELNGTPFSELDEELKNKIFDFQIYLVEIDAIQNPHFDPIDLFIRLNDKPYPIRENSFEMWNSWADVDIIKEIRKLKQSVDKWFFIKQIKRANDRDRMENEELITSLCYIEYYQDSSSLPNTIDIYQKTTRMNSRISTKARISSLMQTLTEDEEVKIKFIRSIKSVKSNIKKIKYVLIDKDIEKNELIEFLKNELEFLFNAGRSEKGFRRRIQDFYFLWLLIEKINFEMVKFHRIEMKKDILEIFKFIKTIPEEYQEGTLGYDRYIKMISDFHNKYKKDARKIKLTEDEKLNIIKEQRNKSSLSSAPIFLGDDIEVDHIQPLAVGGKDEKENLGIAHKVENREKGAKY
ncbi:DUF262 domain-containing protein [Patiriisocius sp. Uisw_047]|uniref:GmrSD restriction endonuclease domain-containing protein n=1 Tax=Patiriisocius sp. Uisw_047 TaxID=3230969 RepID=UPI0039E7B9C7